MSATINTKDAKFGEISASITKVFTEGTSKISPIRATLQLLTDHLGWDVAAFWIVNDLLTVLECAEFYARLKPVADFETVTRARQFYCGEALPGSAWVKRDLIYVPDLSKYSKFSRAWVAERDNLRTGMAFSLYVGNRVLGVIELFSCEFLEISPATQDFLISIGGQIGVYLERLSSGAMLEAGTAEFQIRAEAASLAIFTIDEHSNVLFANIAVERIFGYHPRDLIGKKLTQIMPAYLRHVHETGIARYVASGTRHLNWDGITLPGLHKNGQEIAIEVSFGEFKRDGKRVFTGFVRLKETL